MDLLLPLVGASFQPIKCLCNLQGLSFLEFELSNPTDVVFETSVSIILENSGNDGGSVVDQDAEEYSYPKTTTDRDSSARAG
ncbi:hypothetical protein Dimus_010163 [Dionaea muscipula]